MVYSRKNIPKVPGTKHSRHGLLVTRGTKHSLNGLQDIRIDYTKSNKTRPTRTKKTGNKCRELKTFWFFLFLSSFSFLGGETPTYSLNYVGDGAWTFKVLCLFVDISCRIASPPEKECAVLLCLTSIEESLWKPCYLLSLFTQLNLFRNWYAFFILKLSKFAPPFREGFTFLHK